MSLTLDRVCRLCIFLAAWLGAMSVSSAQPATVDTAATPVPPGTTLTASFASEKDQGPEVLLDGDPRTVMTPGPDTASDPASIFLRFPQPLHNLAGVQFGASDPRGNYYPTRIDFFIDSTGDGRYDTYVGRTEDLGPGPKTAGPRLFQKKPAIAHGLEIRATEQNQTGRRRAFMLSDLQLLTSDQSWDADLGSGPTSPSRGVMGGFKLDPRTPTPIALMRMSDHPKGSAVRGAEHKHKFDSTGRGEDRVLELSWAADDSRPLLEAFFREEAQPPLYRLEDGVVLGVLLDAENAPGLREMAIRVKDAFGETFQWSGRLDPDQRGWQEVKFVLDPMNHAGNWGGEPAHRGKLDAPAVFSGITFTLPQPRAGASVKIKEIRRNDFNADAIANVSLLRQVDLALSGPTRALIVDNPADPRLKLSLKSRAGFELTTRLRARLTAFDGSETTWQGQPVTLAPGQAVSIPFSPQFAKLGWFQVEVFLDDPGAEKTVPAGQHMLAVIDPVGPRPWHDDDFHFSIGGVLEDDESAQWAVKLGVEWDRGGGPDKNTRLTKRPDGEWLDFSKADQQLARAERFGIRYQMLVGFLPPWAAREGYMQKYAPEGWQVSTLAPRPDIWREYMRTVAQRYAGRVKHYEICNEPDLEAFWKGTTEDYLETLRIAHQELKAADPANQVMTGGFALVTAHGGRHLNPDLQARTLAEAQDAFDIHTLHQHGDFSRFAEAIDGPAADMRRLLKEPKPLWLNETATRHDGNLHRQAEQLVKKVVFSQARGAKAYSWFIWYGSNALKDRFSMLQLRTHEPRPTLPAWNALLRQIRNARFVEQPDIGPGQWAFIFADRQGGGSTLVAFSEGAPSTEPLLVRVPEGATAQLIDLMGNPISVTAQHGLVSVPLSERPVYVRVSGDQVLSLAPRPLRVDQVVSGEPGQIVDIDVQLANPTSRAATMRITAAETAVGRFELAAGEQRAERVSLRLPQSLDGQATVRIAYGLEGTAFDGQLNLPVRLAMRAPWQQDLAAREPLFVLDQRGSMVNFHENDPSREHLNWQGPEDLSARIWLGADDNAVTVRVEVRDDRHVQPHRDNRIWQADSVQMALAVPGQQGFWEIGLARTQDDQDVVHVWNVPVGASEAQAFTLQTRPTAGGMQYVATLPLAALKIDPARLGQGVGFNLLVNDSDGEERESFVRVAPGFGQDKHPESWPMVQFRPDSQKQDEAR